ncbi:MAG: DUF2075 domain-containing protein [Lactobacillus sp.]|jgi:DUF2075 family protein/predicted GIY-YIG superfamily endonuclease|nr:DUF2075 domain-containing protein [Lactobacillus sp.]
MDVSQPIISEVTYGPQVNAALKANVVESTKLDYLLHYPTVYIIRKPEERKFRVYVGETNNIQQRTDQHLQDALVSSDWQQFNTADSKMLVVAHEHFNKSLTLDIENQLMNYLMGVPAVEKLVNGRGNPQGKYYPSDEMEAIFLKVWQKLGKINHTLFPTQEAVINSALFKASPFHRLTPEQIEAEDTILNKVRQVFYQQQTATGNLILVNGEAGSGKTVLLSSVFYKLATEFQLKTPGNDQAQQLSVQLLINHDQQKKVYAQIAEKLGLQQKGQPAIVDKPTHFINTHPADAPIDIVLVDEAHLLWTQGKQSYRGKNQMADLLTRAKVVVAVFDEHQVLTTEEYWEQPEINQMVTKAKDQGNFISLKNQLRMDASDATIQWVHDLVFNQTLNAYEADKKYDLRVMASPKDLEAAIATKAKDDSEGLSRVLATFDWPYIDKKKPKDAETWNVEIGEWSMPWNMQLPLPKKDKRQINKLPWAEQPQTINEVGSTYTVQGFDLNYAGVIIGPAVKYRQGKIIFDPDESENKKATRRRTMQDQSKRKVANELLRNELNVLLTRGVHGLYIYAVDPQLQQALQAAMPNNQG